MTRHPILLAAIASLTAWFPCQADVLELQNGEILSGKFAGGTAGTIRFETSSGLKVIETSQALALTFTSGGASSQGSAPAAPAPVAIAATSPSPVTIPAGTTLLVRMVDGASSHDYGGKRFTTTLESDLVVNGVRVVKAGSKVYGRVQGSQQAGRYAGQSTLDLRLAELTVGGVLVPIRTGAFQQAGNRSAGKTIKGAALGTAVGAIAGEAGKGAAIGAVASGLKKGDSIVVPPGTLLEFDLTQSVTVQIGR